MKSANKIKWLTSIFIVGLFSTMVCADQNLDARSQTKVNNAMAKKWATSDGKAANPAQQNKVVNIGDKRTGGCNLNIGTVDPKTARGRQPKDIVVTTKEVINVCK
jgi:hypothetical protein